MNMAVACAFPSCADSAAQFLLQCTHKFPLCDRHFAFYTLSNWSRVAAVAIEEWHSITEKQQLPASSKDVYRSLQDAACAMQRVADGELNKVESAIGRRMKYQCRKVNMFSRRLLATYPQHSCELLRVKCEEIRFIARQRNFNRALVERVRREIHEQISRLSDKVQRYAQSDSVVPSRVVSAFAASRKLLRSYTPCLFDSVSCIESDVPSLLYPTVTAEPLKHIDAKKALKQALNFCLCAVPIASHLKASKSILKLGSNDTDVHEACAIPECCRDISRLLTNAGTVSCVHILTGRKVDFNSFLDCQSFRLCAKAVSVGGLKVGNDTRDARELQEFVETRNGAGVQAYHRERMHQAALLFRAAFSVRKRLMESELQLATICGNMVGTYKRLRDFSTAAAFQKRLVNTQPIESADNFEKIIELGDLLRRARRLHKAKNWMQKVVHLAKTVFSRNHSGLYSSLKKTAKILETQRLYIKEAAVNREIMDLIFRVGAANNPYGDSCCKLANVEVRLQNFASASELLTQANAALEGKYKFLVVQGRLEFAQYRLSEARTCFLSAVRRKAAFKSYLHLSAIAQAEEHFSEAWQWISEAYSLMLEVDYCKKRQAWAACGSLCLAMNDEERAEKWLKAALAVHKTHLSEVPVHGSLQRDLATLAMRQTRYAEAEKLLREALQGDEVVLISHMDVALDLQLLGKLFHLQSRLDESEALLRKALSIQCRVLPRHPQTAESWIALAGVLLDKGDLTGSYDALQSAKEIEEELRPGHSSLARCYYLISRVLLAGGYTDYVRDFLTTALALQSSKPHCASEARDTEQLLASLTA